MDESIEQVEADMRVLEQLLEKNRFASSSFQFQGRRERGEQSTSKKEGLEEKHVSSFEEEAVEASEDRQSRLLSILNDEADDLMSVPVSTSNLRSEGGHLLAFEAEDDLTLGLEEDQDAYGGRGAGAPAPVEVTDMLYGNYDDSEPRSNASTSSRTEEGEGEEGGGEEEEEGLGLTLRDLPSAMKEQRHLHRIPVSISSEGTAQSTSNNAKKKKKRKKKQQAVDYPTTLRNIPRNRHSVANVLEKVSAQEREELTFRPKLAWDERKGKGKAAARTKTRVDVDGSEDRIKKLSRPLTDKWTRRELEKLREEMLEASKYPYAPQIGERSSKLATKPKGKTRRNQGGHQATRLDDDDDDDDAVLEDREPIEVRLMKSNENRESQLRQAKLEKEYADLMHCTFRPNISKSNDSKHLAKDYKPIHERLHKVLQEKSLRLASMRMNKELEDPDLTFAPKINSKSAKLAQMKAIREELCTIDRLASGMVTTSAAASSRGKKKKSVSATTTGDDTNTNHPRHPAPWSSSVALRDRGGERSGPSDNPGGGGGSSSSSDKAIQLFGDASLAKAVPRECIDCTFSPQISKKSKEILKKSVVWNPDFYKRQEQFVEHKEQYLSQGKRSEDPNCTFVPDIGNARQFLQEQENKHLKESKMECVTRLSSRNLEEKRIREESLRESYYSQFDFKPNLSERSKAMASATDLHELVYNEKGEKIRRSIAKEVEEEFNAKCTFKPKLSSSGRAGSKENVSPIASLQIAGDKDTVIQRIETYRQEKELRIREYRQERELEKMQECTFAPQTNQGGVNRAKLNKPVIVHGLTRFLQNRELARLKEVEKKQREAKVFATGKGKPKTCFTVAEPFRLSKSKTAHKKMQKLKQELEDDFAKHCTFKPKVNYF